MKKKILTAAVITLLCCAMFAVGVSAAEWDGSIADEFAGGTGTEADPYRIATAEQLAYLARTVNHGNTYEGVYFRQTADIMLNGTSSENWQATARQWTPIGNSSSYVFSGTFDGNGYTISGLYISTQTNYQGLFGYTYNAALKNITVRDADVTGGSYTGAMVGAAKFYSKKLNADHYVDECTVKNSSVTGKDYVGGIAGYVIAHADGTYTNNLSLFCTFDTCIGENNTIKSEKRAGGIVGYIGSGLSTYGSTIIEFIACTNSGSVTAAPANPYGSSSDIYAGGIAGHCGYSVTFTNCMNSGAISALNSSAGGIAGYCSSSTTVRNCCNAGTSAGSGIVNQIVSGEITNCCSGGTVSGKAITSSAGNAVITGCYYLTDSAAADANAAALTEEQMKNPSSFVGFDFANVWMMGGADYPYPVLRGVNDMEKTDAQTPVIFVQTNSVNCAEGEVPTLFACSSVTDGGTLTYQWYICDTADGTYTAVPGAIHAAYQPAQTSGTKYYYVTVTNTNKDATGVQSVSVNSCVTAVTVGAAAKTYTITGTLITYGDKADVTIELLLNGEVVRTETVPNTAGTTLYTIDNVPAGTYTVRVSKDKHVSRTYEVTVGNP